VIDDVLGTFAAFTPKFAKRYAELAPIISDAVENYTADVRARRFPGSEHIFGNK
jgi:3-methyl-2-oxobutanoate hydroxymethyltransferase